MVSLSSPWGRSLDDGALHFYLAPENAAADDRNPGTSPDLPLATLGAVIDALNALRSTEAPVMVHISSNGGTAHEWPADRVLGPLELGAPVVFIGDGGGQAGDTGYTELFTSTLSVGASNQIIVTGLDAAFPTPYSLTGKTVEFLEGSANIAGYLRTIGQNPAGARSDIAADSIIPANEFAGPQPAIGDPIRIREPSVTINLPESAENDTLATAVPGGAFISKVGNSMGNALFGTDTNSSDAPLFSTSNLYFVNLNFDASVTGEHSRLQLSRSTVCFHGCEIRGNGTRGARLASGRDSMVQLGMDFVSREPRAAMALDLGLAVDSYAWCGWTAAHLQAGTRNLRTVSQGIGFVVADDRVRIFSADWSIYGGFVYSESDQNVTMRVENFSRVRMVPQQTLILCFTNDTVSANSASIDVQGGSSLYMSKTTAYKSGDGACVRLAANDNENNLPSKVSIRSNCLLFCDAADYNLSVSGGGMANLQGNFGDGAGVPQNAQLAVLPTATGVAAAGATGTAAGLAPGDFLPATTEFAQGQIVKIS